MLFFDHFQPPLLQLIFVREYFFLQSVYQLDPSADQYHNHSFVGLLSLHFFKISNFLNFTFKIQEFLDLHFQICICPQFLLFFYCNNFLFFIILPQVISRVLTLHYFLAYPRTSILFFPIPTSLFLIFSQIPSLKIPFQK